MNEAKLPQTKRPDRFTATQWEMIQRWERLNMLPPSKKVSKLMDQVKRDLSYCGIKRLNESWVK